MTDRYAPYQRLLFDRPHPRVLRVTMNNGRMNTADQRMHGELGAVWRDIDGDPTVSAVLLTGGPKVFSAGGDMELTQAIADDWEARARNWKEAKDIVYNVINCSKPIVSAIRGPAVGAGLHPGRVAAVLAVLGDSWPEAAHRSCASGSARAPAAAGRGSAA